MQAKPDTTLAELREILGVPVQLSALWYRLDYLGLTFKKHCTPPSRSGEREDVRLQREV
jgi:transposase